MTTYTIGGANFDVNDSTGTVIEAEPVTLTIVAAEDNHGWNYDVVRDDPTDWSQIEPDIFYVNLFIDGEPLSYDEGLFFHFGQVELTDGSVATVLEFETEDDNGNYLDAYDFFYQTNPADFPDWTTVDGMQSLYDSIESISGPNAGTSDFINFNFFGDVQKTEDDVYTGFGNDDAFFAGLGNDIVRGRGGADTLEGGKGDDRLAGGRGNDELRGNLDNDVLKGGGGADKLFGDQGNDVLRGGRGQDELDGGAGEDLLDGKVGRDILTGGADADTFQFKGNIDGDYITDFELGIDTLKISAAIWGDPEVDTAQELVDTYGTTIDGEFVLDFSAGASGPGADKITFAGIADGSLLVEDIMIF
ncbi:calcium-binding protein [Halovulum sp. GXIMD14794]